MSSNIQAVTALIEFIVDVLSASAKSVGDGSISLSDIRYFKKSAKSLFNILRECGDIGSEIADLSVDDLEEISTILAAKLSLEYDEISSVIDQVIKFFALILRK